jgi:hypothetical protein
MFMLWLANDGNRWAMRVNLRRLPFHSEASARIDGFGQTVAVISVANQPNHVGVLNSGA